MKLDLEKYGDEMYEELRSILKYWMHHTIDETYGGFIGKIDHEDNIYSIAPKGSVLNSRILWTFSSAYNLLKEIKYLLVAERSFHYIKEFFIDKDHGGVYWTVDHKGQPLDTKKQVYAIAFTIYGLSEFSFTAGNEEAKGLAITLYQNLEEYCYDTVYGGYIEALSRDWKTIEDLRLSDKDANEPKSMNTHLHVLEAYASLYRIWPDEGLKTQLQKLVNIFTDHIISKRTGHLVLFFDDAWKERSSVYSFGHDIEAAWLLQEAVEILGDEVLINKIKTVSVSLANTAFEGIDNDGGLWYEFDPSNNHMIRQKHSWPQAEAMIGFFNCWQNTGEEKYLVQSLKSWEFIKEHIKAATGEWVWGINEDGSIMNQEDKVGLWKCPYHNSRACMEIINRIQQAKNTYIYESKESSL